MSPEHFAYWLQGFVELNHGAEPTTEQWGSIKEHLATVFTKVTPPVVVSPGVGTKIPLVVDICRSCGSTGPDGHRFRHPFVSSATLTADQRLQDALDRATRAEQRGEYLPISVPIYPGRIC